MLLHSLIYVSESMISLAADEEQVNAIVEVSRNRNRALGVTGALMFTHSNFVQVLEGAQSALDELMTSIRRDSRHRNIAILEEEALVSRRFATWSMAYVGPAALVESRLAPLVRKDDHGVDPFATQEMISLLRSLVALSE
ncbi:BLUF domain-containing protein [Sphingobium sp.]|uniref:BLUF domain-containing protein n=1 Tax=Sphingobium sp. TaxID=1912891 RepID=UPI0028BE5177|nr:BLUF domain-containing protein [Sphingobium sp.]